MFAARPLSLLALVLLGDQRRVSTMKGSVLAAPLAIVDGTYLCLLPSGDDDEEDVLHDVPALPCHEVWKRCGPEAIDVTDTTTLMHVDEEDENDNETLGNDDIQSKMTTISIRLSDISRYDFRFVHPVNVITHGGSSSVVQISSCCEYNNIIEVGISWSKDSNNLLDICFPSMTCDDDNGEHDFECFEDGDCLDVYGDTSCIELDSSQKIQNSKIFSSSFQVHGVGSCLIADFTGVGGYEQALILPPVESSLMVEDASLNSSNGESVLTQRKHMLQTILANSILTDGSTAFLPQNAEVNISTGPMNSTIFKMSPVNREVVSRSCSKQNAVESQSNDVNMDVDNKSRDDQAKRNDNLTKDDASSNLVPPKDPAWLEAIEQTIESRLAKQVAKENQLERTSQVRSDLIHKGRETIHKAARLHCSGGSIDTSNDPQMLRLRYGARPRTFSHEQHGLSAVIDMEVDIYLPSKHHAEELYDFHVSCTPASRDEENMDNIRTQSGIVPVLQNGNCVTMIASISLNDLDCDDQSNSKSSSTLDFNIQGLWLDNFQKRQGSVLCTLRLLVNDVLFAPVSSATRSGHCIQHEIDFTSTNDETNTSTISPSAVFDYRYPRTLNIDVSGSIGLQGGKIWKDIVSKLNSQIGMGSYIDLYFIKGEPTLKLVIFASNPAEQTAITTLVLQNLPENTKLFEQHPNEVKNVKALLVSLQKEAETFQKHRAMSKGAVTGEMRKEMSSLQASSDGIASTIKGGWV